MKKPLLPALAAAAALLCTSPAHAQSDSTTAAPYRQTLSANPLGLLFGYFNGEYERALTDVASMGASGSYISSYGLNVFTVEGKLRYYPQANVLSGFSVGGSLGYAQGRDGRDDTYSAFLVGVEVDYNWLVGRDRNFFIGSGIGARRLFGGDVDSDEPTAIPTIRLVNIGIAF